MKLVVLPRCWPSGRPMGAHPLAAAWKGYKEAHPEVTLRSFAQQLGITFQAFWIMLDAAKVDRDYLLPPERVPDLCRIFELPPYLFRPDLWTREMSFA